MRLLTAAVPSDSLAGALRAPAPSDTVAAVLRAQLEAQLQFQDALLNVVFWSLGSTVAVGALLVGYSWFTNHRNVARDKEALRNELAAGLTDLSAKLTVMVDERLQASRQELRESMEAAAANLVRRSLSPLQQRIEALQTRTSELSADALITEARHWEHVHVVPSNAFRSYLDLLALGLEKNSGHLIRTAVVGMRQSVSKMTSVFVDEAARANELMAKLPSGYADEAAALAASLKTLGKH